MAKRAVKRKGSDAPPARHASATDPQASVASVPSRHVAAGEFKATCLALMDEVRRTGEEIVITKRGKPVAKLAPVIEEAGTPFLGRTKGWMTIVGDIMAPDDVEWDALADD